MKAKHPKKTEELHMSAIGFDSIMRRVLEVSPPIEEKAKPKTQKVKKTIKKNAKH